MDYCHYQVKKLFVSLVVLSEASSSSVQELSVSPSFFFFFLLTFFKNQLINILSERCYGNSFSTPYCHPCFASDQQKRQRTK